VPELPEAETIARDLDPRLRGARVIGVQVHHQDVLARPAIELGDALLGRTVAGVGRRGKNVVIAFEDEGRLMVNLGMTGRLVLSDAPRAGECRHVAVRLDLEDGRALLYDDVRRFGLIELYEPETWPARDAELGLEPLGDGFTADALRDLTRRTRTPIRNFLLDQTRVAGVGNIYALEALFRAGVRPTRRAHRLTRAQTAALRDALRDVLAEAIVKRGTTVSDYRDGSGEAGGFEPLLRVYGREGRPCVACGTAIRRKVLTNRSAYYCPTCQR
jgi:formamidopyrimidine-DNA glycosylase